jgi:hypothetical protein
VYDSVVEKFEVWTKTNTVMKYVCDTSKPYDYSLEGKFHEHTVHIQLAYNPACGISRCSKAWARSRKEPPPNDDLINKDKNGDFVDAQANVSV